MNVSPAEEYAEIEARVAAGELVPEMLDLVKLMRRANPLSYGMTPTPTPTPTPTTPTTSPSVLTPTRSTSRTSSGQSLADFIAAARTDPPDLFGGLVARGSNVWGGAARSFKTMAALSAMLSVASGQTFLGRTPSRTGDVLYVAEEGGRSKIAERFEVLLRTYQPKHAVRILHRQGITFQNERWDLVRQELSGMTEPALVVLDTYTRMNELDENGSSAAHAALTCMSGLTTDFRVDNILIHHVGVAGSRLRGHTSLKAGVEGTVLFGREEMTNKVKLEAETKDSEPEELKLCWDPETFLLTEREGKTNGSIDGLVQAVAKLGGQYRDVRVSELMPETGWSRQHVQQLCKRARESGLLMFIEKGPQSGYRLPVTGDELPTGVGSNGLQ